MLIIYVNYTEHLSKKMAKELVRLGQLLTCKLAKRQKHKKTQAQCLTIEV